MQMKPARYFAIRRPARYAIVIAVLVAVTALLAGSPRPFAVEERDVAAPEGTRISITGTAKAVARKSFRLDYGEHEVLVLIGESTRYEQERERLDNRKVTVYGRLDRHFFDREQLEATVVFVHGLDTAFYPDAAPGQRAEQTLPQPAEAPEEGTVGIAGKVKATQKDRIVLEAGSRSIAVDTEALAGGSDAAEGISEGDLVLVQLRAKETSLFDTPVFRARSVALLRKGEQG